MKKALCLLAAILLWAPTGRADKPNAIRYLNSLETNSYVYTFSDGHSFQYYAQNNPLWNDMLYEKRTSNRKRTFGGSGCNPTSMAMVIASLVPKSDYDLINKFSYKKKGYMLNPYTVYATKDSKDFENAAVQTPEEYQRYLPVVIGAYAAGNNKTGQADRNNGGTGTAYFKTLCSIYNITYTRTRNTDEIVDALQGGKVVVALAARKYSPLTDSGHYVFIPYCDDEYLYVFDSLQRESYPKDKEGIIDQISPGILRIRLKDIKQMYFCDYFIFSRA